MGLMTDAVDPANIPAELDGQPALRISVLANSEGEAFDGETGDAGPSAVADALAVRAQAGKWSVLYVDESSIGAYLGALATKGLRPAPASEWPAPGVYLWCAAPEMVGNQVPGWAPVAPLAVQNHYLGTIDESTTFGTFPAAVAGYIDGPVSTWPSEAWARFGEVGSPTPAPGPARAPTPPVHPAPTQENPDMLLVTLTDDGEIGAKDTSWLVTANGLLPAIDPMPNNFPRGSDRVSNSQAMHWSAKTARS